MKQFTLNDKLLKDYIQNYLGYGKLESNYWFIGMEEGGCQDCEQMKERLEIWYNFNKPLLYDNKNFHQELSKAVDGDFMKFFRGKNSSLQSTWNGLIKFLFEELKNEELNETERRLYQSEKLGSLEGETALLELMPLPSPSTDDWIFGKCSELDDLESREKYIDAYVDLRINLIKKKINQHKPENVIFYGKTYLKYWYKIIGDVNQNYLVVQPNQKTRFYIISHPVRPSVNW